MSTPETNPADILAALYDPDPLALSRLRDSLVGAAADANLIDVAYRTVDSPVGTLLLAATDQGLVRVAFDREDHDLVLVGLADKISPRVLLSPRRLDDAARQLADYFAGRRRSFELPLDFRLATGFRRAVLAQLTRIGYGQTESYSQVALAAGSPRAVRAVGTACATNPIPVVVPCHRVVRSDGTFGGYRGGPAAKSLLLSLERTAA
ncbi:MAG: methylated-DNA--[protein]-cysteine S-methyltransferase [Nakamurella sp.]